MSENNDKFGIEFLYHTLTQPKLQCPNQCADFIFPKGLIIFLQILKFKK